MAEVYFQCGPDNLTERAALDMLAQVLHPCSLFLSPLCPYRVHYSYLFEHVHLLACKPAAPGRLLSAEDFTACQLEVIR